MQFGVARSVKSDALGIAESHGCHRQHHPRAAISSWSKTAERSENRARACQARERIEQLITDLDAEDERIVIPTPVLCEFLILADREGPLYLEKIQGAKTLLLKPFDERAAIELAGMELSARSKGGKKAGFEAPYQKVKFDRQIVAIARANEAHTIYSDDQDLGKFAKQAGLRTKSRLHLGSAYSSKQDSPLR